MEENNNPYNNPNNQSQDNQPVGSNQQPDDRGQTQSEHTGYEQPGVQQPQDQSWSNNQQSNNLQGYPQNNQGQYGQQNYSQNQQYNQNPYGYNQYSQNPYNQNQYQYQEPKGSNAMAVASLVCGIVALLISCCWFISLPLSITSVVLGIIVLNKKKEGRTLAIIGIILGAATILICILLVALSAYMYSNNSGFMNYYKEFYKDIYNDIDSSIY
jgi:hypothetical protein